ncbi:MAG TPA: type IX secretion system outer membrane channel protein PorV [Puia sp.]|nr:type IX secretion system outer membrane channel protein PorV [Puia sp.]
MKRSYQGLAAVLLLSFVGINGVYGQTSGNQQLGPTTTAVPFLLISPDARAGAMGDLGVGTTPDASASWYNLAKTPFNTKDVGFGLTYTPWLKDLGLQDVYLLAASGYYKFAPDQALSASIRYFSLGNIQFTDFNGNNIGTGHPREMALDVGYSRKLSEKLGIGLTGRYIYSNLASGYASAGATYQPGKTFAVDISLFYHGVTTDKGGWNFGLALKNLGGKIGYTNSALDKDFIPADLGLGASYTAVFNEDNKVMFGLDMHKLLVPVAPAATNSATQDSINGANYASQSVVSSWGKSFSDGEPQFKTLQFSLGAEYSYQNMFFLRLGYYYQDPSKGDLKYFSTGVGLRYNVMELNFSYLVPSGSGTNRNPLSNTLRFGLIFYLDSKSDNNNTSSSQQ